MKTVFVRRDGSLSVAAHLAEMNAWLAEHKMTARELVMLRVLNFQLVFRATFERDADADAFVAKFG
ncbi:MAG TPA: hypothetical protein VM782_07405 [Stellaceae bacterium]|nr:hypothetical protein [Stellaceae bacterium]